MKQSVWLLSAWTVLLGAAGCTQKRTELVIGIATDLPAPGSLSDVRMEVFREGIRLLGRTWTIPGGTQVYELPNAIGLVSGDGSPTRVDITVTGLLGQNPIVTRDATVGLVSEQTLFLRMGIVLRCMGMSGCPNSNDTCVEGHCQAKAVDSRTLPVYVDQMEARFNCQGVTHFIDTRTNSEILPTSQTCAPDEFCQEGTCYKNLPGGGPDGGTTSTGWQQIQTAPAATPPARSFAGASQAVYDPALDRTMMWGGTGAASAPVNDTWAFDGGSWLQLASDIGPAGAEPIGPTAFDRMRKVIVTYREPSGDLYEFAYNTPDFHTGRWTVLARGSAAGSPPPRLHARMAYDQANQVAVLFGGQPVVAGTCSALPSTGYCNDTWTWNGTAWTPATASSPPDPRRDGALEFSESAGKVILFGGRGDAGPLSDTWSWSGSAWARLAQTFPNMAIFDVGGLLTFDPVRMRLLWLNGTREAYTFDGTMWGGSPFVDMNAPLLGTFSGAFHKGQGAIVVFGGTDPRGQPLAQTWFLNVP